MYSVFMEDIYRRAASVVLLRPASGESAFQLLLLHKPRKRDDWQLPQGGVEQGETIEQAALRELHEEAGVREGVKVLGKSSRTYKYDFPPSYRRFCPDNVCGQSIEYVFALAPENAKVCVDNKEIDGHIWITGDALSRYIRRKEYLEFAGKLVDEAILLAEKVKP